MSSSISKALVPGLATLLLLTACQQQPTKNQESLTQQVTLPPSVSSQQTSVEILPPSTQQPSSSPDAGFTTKTIVKNEQFYTVNAAYPETKNLAINIALQSLVNSEVEPFLKDAPTSASAAPGPYTLDISYRTTSFSAEIMSFVFGVDVYTGGAHPNHYILTKTFNLTTGKEILLGDVFAKGQKSSYLAAISQKTSAEIKKNLGDMMIEDMLQEGTAPDEKNFRSFSLEPGKITFYFDPYAVAPYAAGPQTVTIALNDFGTLVDPAFASQGEAMGKAGMLPLGKITGNMGYPAEGIPAEIIVCADNLESKTTTCTKPRKENSSTILPFELSVPEGTYYVYETGSSAYGKDYKAYYSEFVTCGSSVNCTSHKPIKVDVKSGETVKNIAPTDWYNL